MLATPFTDHAAVRDLLYREADRLTGRTAALRRAKVSGPDAAATIVDLLSTAIPQRGGRILDLGCGRGSTTLALARRWPSAELFAVDLSTALLRTARSRLPPAEHRTAFVTGDFHGLPLPDGEMDAVVAAFCLYHAPDPQRPLSEIRRCLRPAGDGTAGNAVLVTKSDDSYASIAALLSDTCLDSHALSRPSLYSAFHSGNAEEAVSRAGLVVRGRVDQRHVFRFADAEHLAAYIGTCPQYQLDSRTPAGTDVHRLAAALHQRARSWPFETESTVTYLITARS